MIKPFFNRYEFLNCINIFYLASQFFFTQLGSSFPTWTTSGHRIKYVIT